MTYYFLQSYWWFLISLLAGILVFLMFVQGANVQLINSGLSDIKKRMIANSTGRKWELAFTTLVVFGGAFFASFPLFYSTSFGGAYWVWMLLLATFVFQAVSYEFLHKKDNLLGVKGFRIALVLNGFLAPFLIGTAVGTFFTGSDFIINKTAILDVSSPIISSWGNAWRGLDALAQPHAVLLGVSLVGLTTILGALYLINNIKDSTIESKMRATIKFTALPFVALFVTWLVILILRDGYAVDSQGVIYMEEYKYLNNLLDSPITLIMLLLGVIFVLLGIWFGAFTKSRKGIWFGGFGTIITVMAVFFIAGYNNTAFYPSFSNMQSSLTITN
ncbi:MAG: cytochrome d ubiquinol oxidase subunit II, partial [Bacteroidales bacterium]|nr:cytochrome d ubiquinol oxidase subunit II [Bacteroidales bacterium]